LHQRISEIAASTLHRSREATVQTSSANRSIQITARKIAVFEVFAIVIVLTLTVPPQSSAQSANTPHFEDYPQLAMFGGAGANLSEGHSQGAMQLGGAIGQARLNAWWGWQLEGGYIGRWANFKTGSALFSANYLARGKFAPNKKFIPFVTTGYSRLSHAGNAINFGGGVEYRLGDTDALRIELRDYYSSTEPRQHNLALRIGWVMYLPD
jgi:hypothetical protein